MPSNKIKLLKVGDPHVTLSNLEEARSLIRFIAKTAKEEGVDYIVLFGDLFHTHSVLRMEVLAAWYEMVCDLLRASRVIIMEGNHDQPGSKELEGKMSAVRILGQMVEGARPFYHAELFIVSAPEVIAGIGFAPYTSDAEKFYQWSEALYADGAEHTLCCHQTFEGSQFDNGMYAPGGLDPKRVRQAQIVSGHIHKQQAFGNVIYIGSPKWDSAVDAEQEKGIWLVEAENGIVDMDNAKFVPTAGAVVPMRKLVIKEGDQEPEALTEGTKWSVELVGSSAWVSKTKKKYVGKAAIKSTFTDAKNRAKRETTGRSTIHEFLEKDFQPSQGVSREKLAKYVQGEQ
jgi:DNA repair exonuclease SbcCD nuclease subunit